MKTKMILVVMLMIAFVKAFAQQDSQYTNYMYNTMSINPAYAGNRGGLSVFGLHRTQWVGLDGAPKTGITSINGPIKDSNVAIGISFVNDKIGPSDENTVSADMSYTIRTSYNSKLSFGVRATANLLNVNFSKLDTYDLTDPLFQNNIENRFSPNIGTGAFFHTDRFYVGLSVPNILETSHYNDNISTTAKERMHFYLISGYVFDLSKDIKFKPAFMTKAVSGSPLQLDITANFMINEKFVLGAAWRWDASVSALAGFQVSKNWLLGYGYDAETTKLANYNSGSHEIFIRYEFKGKSEKVLSPRFF